MSKIYIAITIIFTSFLLTGCSSKKPIATKPNPYPKNPNYAIIKPKPEFKPSKKNLAKMVKKLEGKPYVWAEEGPECFDCSGYTYYMFGKMGIEIPRVARAQIKSGLPVNVNELKYGDLIFFDTTKNKSGKITHVGMYLKDGWFTHASTTKHEVRKDNLYTNAYYKDRYRGARRYLGVTQEQIYLAQRQKPIAKQPTTRIAKARSTTTPKVAKAPVSQTSKVAKAPVSQTNKQGYYVQLGSFSKQPHSTLLNKIKQQGYGYTLMPTPNTQASKLLIGPFANRNDANNTLASVKKNIIKDAFVTKISS